MYGLNKGTRIAQFSLEQQLGQGGQGSVWKAFAIDGAGRPTGAPVALKIIPVRGTPTTMVERVRREAEALSRLSSGHPSVVSCLGVHEDPTLGVLAVVMELVDGVDLQGALRDPRCDGPAREAILLHVAEALGFLHDNGIVHRDIKPQNILIKHSFFSNQADPSGVKLVDFGIATPTGNPKPLTEVGTVIGTPAYMPPERIDPIFWQVAKGLPCEDVFSLGVVAYETLFGRHPAGVEDDGTLSIFAERYRAVSRSGELWPTLPPGHRWSAALQGSLALKVDARLPNGKAVASAVNSGATVNSPPLRQPQRTEIGAPIPLGLPDVGIAPPGQTQAGQVAPFAPAPAGSWTPPTPQGSSPSWSPAPVVAPGVPPPPAYPTRGAGSKGSSSPIRLLMGLVGVLAIGVPTAVLAARFVGNRETEDPPITAPTDSPPPTETAPAAPPPTDTTPPVIPTPTFVPPDPPPTQTSTPPSNPPPKSTATTKPTATGTPTAPPTTTSTGNGTPPKIGPGATPTTTTTTPPPGTTTTQPNGRPPPIRIIIPGFKPGGQPTTQPTTTSTSTPPGGRPPIIRFPKKLGAASPPSPLPIFVGRGSEKQKRETPGFARPPPLSPPPPHEDGEGAGG